MRVCGGATPFDASLQVRAVNPLFKWYCFLALFGTFRGRVYTQNESDKSPMFRVGQQAARAQAALNPGGDVDEVRRDRGVSWQDN